MLLHMIEASQPINFAMDGVAHLGRRSLDQMQNTLILCINAINHSSLAKCPGVCRLTAAGRVESSAIERHSNLAVIALAEPDHARIEFEEP